MHGKHCHQDIYLLQMICVSQMLMVPFCPSVVVRDQTRRNLCETDEGGREERHKQTINENVCNGQKYATKKRDFTRKEAYILPAKCGRMQRNRSTELLPAQPHESVFMQRGLYFKSL